MSATLTEIAETPAAPLAEPIRAAFAKAMLDSSAIDPAVLAIEGMSGRRYRHFINNLIRALPNPRYLEIGSWAGSTLCSAINRNQVDCVAIDNWSQFGGPKDRFIANVKAFIGGKAKVRFIERDFRKVDYAALGTFGVYLFDGPHEAVDHYDALRLVSPALEQQFVFIVDDWNWAKVRDGTLRAIADMGMGIRSSIEGRTTLDDSHPRQHGANSEWHNGYFLAVLEKGAGG